MRARFALSKYLPWIVFVTIVVDPAFSNANQIAQGLVKVQIMLVRLTPKGTRFGDDLLLP
jgi:hypothetical protein